jgi:hypothetical protein
MIKVEMVIDSINVALMNYQRAVPYEKRTVIGIYRCG